MADQSIDMNLNVAQCLREAPNWGHTTIYNVCKGTNFDVPWGSIDWFSEIVAWAFVIALISFLILGARWLWRDV